jgi:hypothetical protein
MVFSGELLAHPGHGAPEDHFHGWGLEHVLLFAAIFAVLAFAVRKS